MATRPRHDRVRPPRAAGSPRAVPRGRTSLEGHLRTAIAALEADRALALFVLDIDGFRRFNADHGYVAGDAYLADLGRRIARTPGGRAYALGADAFALVLVDETEDL